MSDLGSLLPPWREVYDLMWEAYLAGSIPVGAAIADGDGAIVARGRNRIFDVAHADQLAGTRLAHAEVNALVGLTSQTTYDPELLHLRHMLWRVPASNVVRLYRELRPDLVAQAEVVPGPPDAATRAEAFARATK